MKCITRTFTRTFTHIFNYLCVHVTYTFASISNAQSVFIYKYVFICIPIRFCLYTTVLFTVFCESSRACRPNAINSSSVSLNMLNCFLVYGSAAFM